MRAGMGGCFRRLRGIFEGGRVRIAIAVVLCLSHEDGSWAGTVDWSAGLVDLGLAGHYVSNITSAAGIVDLVVVLLLLLLVAELALGKSDDIVRKERHAFVKVWDCMVWRHREREKGAVARRREDAGWLGWS